MRLQQQDSILFPATLCYVLSNMEKKYALKLHIFPRGFRTTLDVFRVVVAVNRIVPFVPSRRTQSVSHEPLRRQGSSTTSRPPQPLSAQAIKHIWVRTALFEKVLDKIVQYIVDNSR